LRALQILGRAQDGATLVEFALVAPIFLALLFGTIELGRALWTQQALQQTAIVGARCMALPACASGIDAYVQEVARQWGVSPIALNLNPCGSTSGFSEVLLTFTFQSAVPTLLQFSGGGIPLTATACFPNP
jgi:hypothetical protein